MTPPGLTAEDLSLLNEALNGPLTHLDTAGQEVCMKLCGLKLLQRAGGVAAANGWKGPPHVFFLTRDGWSVVKDERRSPVRRTG